MWKNLSKKGRLLVIVSGISIGTLLFFALTSPRSDNTGEETPGRDITAPYVPEQFPANPNDESQPIDSEPVESESPDAPRGSVDVNTLDVLNMALDYEAMALMSTYYYISAGDIGEESRRELLRVSSPEVADKFNENWAAKRMLADENPQLMVFMDAIDVSDAPAGDSDTAVAILAEIFRSVDGSAVEFVGTVRWTVFFDITPASDSGSEPAKWTISRFIIRNID